MGPYLGKKPRTSALLAACSMVSPFSAKYITLNVSKGSLDHKGCKRCPEVGDPPLAR